MSAPPCFGDCAGHPTNCYGHPHDCPCPKPAAAAIEEAESTEQDWRGLDGATAFLLIERHADGWGEIRRMMEAWREANRIDALPDCRLCKHFAPGPIDCEHANACVGGSRFDAFFEGGPVTLYQPEVKP